ncbi:ABC-2 type transport system permease protein [Pseudobutyrivibrio sp. UC1225]|uniref:ABC transporter permease n=1 Tax=Pseudobutyrivibrio sp. UC1225 TaxID=1798185 RepID=UPI0008DEE7C9|nr:ABC transporter permease [Pseudobutyrivibrio sp. UC1225]SFO21004.1 ABC-2 type transport system permease protein [Pseudobutyrivibrio sp. UC1225]
MRYLLLLKRFFRKKSYILMLLLVPLMVFLLKEVGHGQNSIMSIGVYIPGEDASSQALRENLEHETGAIQYQFYDSEDDLKSDVANQTLTEGWIVPEDLDALVQQVASNQYPSERVQVIIREAGLSHLLGKEIICSRIYPSVAKQLLINYMRLSISDGEMSAEQISHIEKSFDSFGLSDSLFKASYMDSSEMNETPVILMPLRGILAMWLMLCGIATSMYYLEDQENGLFIWWHSKMRFCRDLGYYTVAFIAPSIITVISLIYSGTFTTATKELPALILYVLATIFFSMALRIIGSGKKFLGMLTPALIILSTLLSPVFVDLKSLRQIQKCCPAFHYLSSIHDTYYMVSLLIYTIFLGGLVILLLKLSVKVRQVLKADLL